MKFITSNSHNLYTQKDIYNAAMLQKEIKS